MICSYCGAEFVAPVMGRKTDLCLDCRHEKKMAYNRERWSKLAEQNREDDRWIPVLWLGKGQCPFVLCDKYNKGTRLSLEELNASAHEGALPEGIVYQSPDGSRRLIVRGKVDKPQYLVKYGGEK